MFQDHVSHPRGAPMNTDQVSPVVQRHVTESVCDARLAVQHLIDEVRAAFGEMDELLERAERLIASSPRRSEFGVLLGALPAAP